MKLYVTTSGLAPSMPFIGVWTASQGDASKAKTAMVAHLKEKELPHRGVEYKAVEIDTKKEGLLAFLNALVKD